MSSSVATTELKGTQESTPRESKEHEMPESKEATAEAEPDVADLDDEEYPSGLRLFALIVSLMLGMFLIGLDNVRFHESSHQGDITDSPSTDHHWDSNPKDHRRVPRSEQGLVVRICLFHDLWVKIESFRRRLRLY
jgi:hypothetical protein